jgi:hypothetical protein
MLYATVSAPGCVPALARISLDGPGRTLEVEVVVEPEGAAAGLALQVLDERGEPLRAIDVFYGDATEREFWVRQVSLDEAGRGRTPMPPGRYRLRFVPPRSNTDCRMPVIEWADFHPGNTTELFPRLPLGGRIRVTIRNPDGTLAGAEGLRLRTPEGEPVRAWMVHEESENHGYLIPGPRITRVAHEPGAYVVEILRQDEALATETVRIDPGEITEVELHLPE